MDRSKKTIILSNYDEIYNWLESKGFPAGMIDGLDIVKQLYPDMVKHFIDKEEYENCSELKRAYEQQLH